MRKLVVMLAVLSCVASVVSALSFTSQSQNSNSATTTNRNQTDSRQIVSPGGFKRAEQAQEDFSTATWDLPDNASATRNPVASSPESISKGKELYLSKEKGNCIFCHGETGSGNQANYPKLRRKPADLTDKERMKTMTDGEVFWKITKGINGIMPAGERRMTEEERWNVVNYVRTLAQQSP